MNESSTPTTPVQAERLAGCFVTKISICFLDPITVLSDSTWTSKKLLPSMEELTKSIDHYANGQQKGQ
jgi:hypothetical protein